ncbi:MAG: hypothetical protein FWD36_01240 [Treponema sp.]|nr:hypothetical protein [Treponema sp.]
MAKKHTGFWAVLVLLISFTVFYGCAGEAGGDARRIEVGTFEGLSAETERQIKFDFLHTYLDPQGQLSLSIDDVQIDYYIGNYNGYEIIVFLGNQRSLSGFVIEDLIFDFPRLDTKMLLWKQDGNSANGHFYDADDITYMYYALNLLTLDDLHNIYALYLACDMWNGDFESLGLSAETERQMKLDYYTALPEYEQLYIPSINHVWFDYYLGTYNDYVIMVMQSTLPAISIINVGGFEFSFSHVATMYAWNSENGQFYIIGPGSLAELDYNDFMTADDIESMYDLYLIYH